MRRVAFLTDPDYLPKYLTCFAHCQKYTMPSTSNSGVDDEMTYYICANALVKLSINET